MGASGAVQGPGFRGLRGMALKFAYVLVIIRNWRQDQLRSSQKDPYDSPDVLA